MALRGCDWLCGWHVGWHVGSASSSAGCTSALRLHVGSASGSASALRLALRRDCGCTSALRVDSAAARRHCAWLCAGSVPGSARRLGAVRSAARTARQLRDWLCGSALALRGCGWLWLAPHVGSVLSAPWLALRVGSVLSALRLALHVGSALPAP